jgi:hypothetical protein
MLPVLEAERIYNLSQSVFLGTPPQSKEGQDLQAKLIYQLDRIINEQDSATRLSEQEFKAKLLSAGISIEEIGNNP